MTPDEQLYKNNFRHFGARLSLRYGILITFWEYVILCKNSTLKTDKTYKRKDGKGECAVGYILIHNQNIRVVKSIHLRGKPLLTALNPAQ